MTTESDINTTCV